MAILKDARQNGHYIELCIGDHILGEDEGSRMYFKYVRSDHLYDELKFGWTNRVIKSYIEATSQFPLEELNGLYSSYEKHLYELSWTNDNLPEGQYKLHFYGADQDFELVAAVEDIRNFGHALNAELQYRIACSISTDE